MLIKERNFLMNKISWLKDCLLQRSVQIYSRFELNGNLLLVNSLTNKFTELDFNGSTVWETINGQLTTFQIINHLTDKLEKGKKLLKAIEFLHDNKFIYVVDDSNVSLEELNKTDDLYNWRIYSRTSTKYRWESPDILYLFETSPQKRNPFLLLNHFRGRIWEECTKGNLIFDLILKITKEFGDRAKFKNILNFLFHLETQGLISFQENIFKEFIPSEEFSLQKDKFSLINWHMKNTNMNEDINFDIEKFMRKTQTPWFLVWEMTYGCNFRCKHCYAAKFEDQKIHLEPNGERTRKEIAKNLIIGDITHITLMGGEATLVPDFYEIVKEFKKANIYVKLQTNGSTINEGNLKKLEDIGINQVEISVDGTTEVVNDNVRGKGSYAKIIKALELLKGSKIPRKGICYTVTSNNFYDVDNVYNFAKHYNIDEVFFSKFFETGRGSKLHWSLTPEQRSQLRSKIDFMNKIESKGPNLQNNMVIFAIWGCSAGKTYCVVDPYGNLRPCTLHDVKVGNILNSSLQLVWKSASEFNQLRFPYEFKEMCMKCNEKYACEGTICSSRIYRKEKNIILNSCINDINIAPDDFFNPNEDEMLTSLNLEDF